MQAHANLVLDKKDVCAGADDEGVACDLTEDDVLPLCYMERPTALLKELLHQTSAGRVVSFSPGAADIMEAAIDMRKQITVMCVSVEQKEVVERTLVSRLKARMNDQTSERFFISDRKLGLEEEPAANPPANSSPVSRFASGSIWFVYFGDIQNFWGKRAL